MRSMTEGVRVDTPTLCKAFGYAFEDVEDVLLQIGPDGQNVCVLG